MKGSVAVDHFASGVRGQETLRLDLQFSGIVCTEAEDMARQEYKLQSDLSYQVQRFGAGLPFQSGELNTDLDLTKAFELIEESQQRWLSVPKSVRDRYQSWANVEAAAQSGELAQFLKTLGVDGGVLPSKPGVSASDSAPVDGPKS